jgi:hypothetical protein
MHDELCNGENISSLMKHTLKKASLRSAANTQKTVPDRNHPTYNISAYRYIKNNLSKL